MERLTKSLSNGNASWNYPIICFGEDDSKNKVFKSVHRQKACEKLSAYEETGLEPEDMKKAFNEDATLKLAGQILSMSPDRLRELAQAEKEGRLVVLPCSIGDPVFMGTGRYKITGYEEDVCDGFYIGRDGVLQVKAQNYNGNHGTYGVIGQTAELTREAAEAALEEMEAEHEQTD